MSTLVRARRNRGGGGCQNIVVHDLEVWFRKILERSNYTRGQRWDLFEHIFSPDVSRVRGNKRERQTGPPGNMWCFSVVFRMATCGSEVEKTRRRDISKEGIGTSHQDPAIRSLGSLANATFAQSIAVDDGGPDPTRKCGTDLLHQSARVAIQNAQSLYNRLLPS